MVLNQQKRHELQSHSRQNLSEATEMLLKEDDLDKADRAFKKAELSRGILSLDKAPSHHLFYSSIFALFCFVVVSFLWFSPRPKSRVHLAVHAETVVLRLEKEEIFRFHPDSGIQVDAVRLIGAVKIEAPGLGLTGTGSKLNISKMEKGSKTLNILRWIEISPGALLEVERRRGYVNLYVKDGTLAGEIELQDVSLQLNLDGQLQDRIISGSGPSNTLTFTSSVDSSHQVRLRLQTGTNWRLDGLQISGIAFQRESSLTSSTELVSSLLKGTIELPEIKRKEELFENDWIRLQQPNSTRLYLNFAAGDDDSFETFFQGWARSVSAGPKGFEHDLTPSWLTWIYHQEQLSFFWGALIFVVL